MVPLCRLDHLPPGSARGFEPDGPGTVPIVVVRSLDGEVHAYRIGARIKAHDWNTPRTDSFPRTVDALSATRTVRTSTWRRVSACTVPAWVRH